jgi:hypothetical protein
VSTVRLPAADLRERLLAVHRPDTPFVVRDGSDEGVDLVAELRFGDPEWLAVFREVALDEVYTIRMRIDEGRGEVRKKEKLSEIQWRKGGEWRPKRFGGEGGVRIGEQTRTIKSITYTRAGGLRFEKGATFSYKTQDLREPLARAIYRAGWECRNVIFRRV